MDKRKLEAYSVWAKENLEQQIEVSLRAIGINGENDIKPMQSNGDVYTIEGSSVSYTKDFFNTRKKVVEMVRTDGFQTVIEETAYTWFNRFIALRFMELHDYLSHGFRVLSNPSGGIEPEILRNLSLVKADLSLNMEKCSALKEQNKLEELYRYVLLQQCKALEKSIPMLFSENTSAYELLLPNILLTGESILTKLLEIPEENFLEDVEVIGWLYQYYVSVDNARVYDGNMSKAKVPTKLLSAATTLYTPHWAIQYMVENSLGRLWKNAYPNSTISANWKYFLECTEPAPDSSRINVEEIKFLDPCMGSGHILVYAFEVLMQIYLSCGYSEKDAAYSIVQNNLWGLDLDKRAYQLACFAVIMKARKYDKRFLDRMEKDEVDLNLSHFQDLHIEKPQYLDEPLKQLVEQFLGADTFGSLLTIEKQNGLEEYIAAYVPTLDFGADKLAHYGKLYQILTGKYHVVCTNPPYLGNNRFNDALNSFVKEYYLTEKSDLSMAMFRHAVDQFAAKNGFVSFITTSSWFFLSSFEKTREYMLSSYQIDSIVDFGTELFEGKVGHNPIVSWVLQKSRTYKEIIGIRLVDFCYSRRDKKESEFFNPQNHYTTKQENFFRIPGSPLAYWISPSFFSIFQKHPALVEVAQTFRGLQPGNVKYVREWYEVSLMRISLFSENNAFWFPMSSGGDYRKWYGNLGRIVDWANNGSNIKNSGSAIIPNEDRYFKSVIGWSRISSGALSFRSYDEGYIPGDATGCIFAADNLNIILLGCLNSNVIRELWKTLNPNMTNSTGIVSKIPVPEPQTIENDKLIQIKSLVKNNIELSRKDWNAFETGWDFKQHPLIAVIPKNRLLFDDISDIPIAECFDCWTAECEERFTKLKANEEELNRIFIEIYGLQDELKPDVEDKDVTVCRIFNSAEDIPEEMKKSKYALTKHDVIVSLISYLVGVVMGRYSLNADGLAYAGGEWDASKYQTYQPDDDGIIPIYPFVGMENGLTAQITKLIKMIFGETAYRDNIDFIADALGIKSSEGSEEALNRYLNNDFYKDHLQTYQKRPIYWMFSSGKQNGFKCLIYMHRYDEDTLARINAKYFLPESTRLKNEMEELAVSVTTAEGKEKVRLEKKRQAVAAQYQEAIEYGQVLDHMANKYIKIDLDDGVKVNYAKFQGIELVTDSGTKIKKDLLVPIK